MKARYRFFPLFDHGADAVVPMADPACAIAGPINGFRPLNGLHK